MADATILLHRGTKFANRGAGLFLKDVMHDGKWVHPLTDQIIEVTRDIRVSIESNMKKFIAAGNKVPMPDGHTTDTDRNKGFWPGPFIAMGDDVLAVAQPKDAQTKKQMEDGTADAVSVCWYADYKDSQANLYKDVFEHICLTNYPVIGEQRDFVALSMYEADKLAAIAVPEEDEALLRGLEKVYVALKQGAQNEIEKIMRTPAERLAALMAKCPLK